MMMMGMAATEERKRLCELIGQWNENRMELFALSEPTETLEFCGVMRFYYQEPGEKVSTKCMRVSSSATTSKVISALIEKFHPDMKMLSICEYSLWEMHESGASRRLDDEEHPLMVQLGWHQDALEGRFLMKRDDKPLGTPLIKRVQSAQNNSDNENPIKRTHQRRFSKREQKVAGPRPVEEEEEEEMRSIYAEVPENTFTRTISNPEAVMKKQRERKLENKIREMGEGGSLKIFGVELFPSRPYVTLLVRADNTAAEIVKLALQKYSVEGVNSADYMLVEILLAEEENMGQCADNLALARDKGVERVVRDEELPLLKLSHCPSRNLIYVLRKRSAFLGPLPQVPFNGEDGTLPAQMTTARVAYADSDVIYQQVPLPMRGNSPRSQLPLDMDLPFGGRLPPSSQSYPLGFSPQWDPSTYCRGTRCGPLPPRVDITTPSLDPLAIPCLVELYPEREDEFLRELAQRQWPDGASFRLVPAYTLYMIVRHRVVSLPASRHQHYLDAFLHKVTYALEERVHAYEANPAEMLFWLENKSELLHMLERDDQLSGITAEVRHAIAQLVETCFKFFVESRQASIHSTLAAFLAPPPADEDADSGLAEEALVNELDATMLMIRESLLNSAFTIQIFSHLFHGINTFLFNQLVQGQGSHPPLTLEYSKFLRDRLYAVSNWANSHGLEQTYECHMDRLVQALNLLITPKTMDQIASLGATCYKLNSLQVRYLLENSESESGNAGVNRELVETVCYLALQQADLTDVQPIQLEERRAFHLPFLIPKEGYVIEALQGVPTDLSNYLSSLHSRGLVAVLPQSHSTGWTGHMGVENDQPSMPKSRTDLQHSLTSRMPHRAFQSPHRPFTSDHTTNCVAEMQRKKNCQNARGPVLQLHRITLQRCPKGGIGLSIVAAQGIGDKTIGIYVKKVVEGTPAHRDGRLAIGDKLLSVNGNSLLGISQEEAAQRMLHAGQELHFEVAKGVALTNGLDTWLRAGTMLPDRGAWAPPPPLRRNYSASELLNAAQLSSEMVSLPNPTIPPKQYASDAHSYSQYRPGYTEFAGEQWASRPSNSSHITGGNGISNEMLMAQYSQGHQPYRSMSTIPAANATCPSKSNGQWQVTTQAAYYPAQRVGQPLHGEDNDNSSTNSSGGNEIGAMSLLPLPPHDAGGAKQRMQEYRADGGLESAFTTEPALYQQRIAANKHMPPSATFDSTPLLPPTTAYSQMWQGQNPAGNGAAHTAASRWQGGQIQRPYPMHGRNSAPLFGAENYLQCGFDQMRAREVANELDQLNEKSALSEAERLRYRQLLELFQSMQVGSFGEAAQGRMLGAANGSSSSMLPKRVGPILPYISEMESKLQEKRRNQTSSLTVPGRPASHQPIRRSYAETQIDDVTQTAVQLAANWETTSEELGQGGLNSPQKKDPTDNFAAAQTRPLQFRAYSDRLVNAKANCTPPGGQIGQLASGNGEAVSGELKAPCFDAIAYDSQGNRRFADADANRHLRTVADGTHLGFRDKMRLYAAEIVEPVGPNREIN